MQLRHFNDGQGAYWCEVSESDDTLLYTTGYHRKRADAKVEAMKWMRREAARRDPERGPWVNPGGK